jgi:DNA (cytosine-5)-methyltransferase 1
MKHIGLFEGIGGFGLAARRVGWETVAWCEINPFCQKVLLKRFPNAQQHEDIKKFDGTQYRGSVDIITGGFPCQNISLAAAKGRVGIDGGKSGLWREMLRICEEARPRFIIIENSATITGKGLSTILDAFAGVGYDSEWYRLEPRQFGLPQKRRQRTYVILYPIGFGDRLPQGKVFTGWDKLEYATWRDSEPRICRVVDGIPYRVDRHRALGNAIVHQIAVEIFKSINKIERPNIPHRV